MRASDAYTIAHLIPSKELMRRAGEGIFRAVPCWKPPVGIIAGKGNNAGDGYVVARLLQEAGIPAEIILLEERFSEDGRYYYDICREHGIPARLYGADTDLRAYGTLVDCLLGTGFAGEVREPLRGLIEKMNASGAYIVSADINSGLNGDTGLGSVFVRSDLTVSIGDYKTGHFRGSAGEAMKAKTNVDIGIRIIGPYIEIEEAQTGAAGQPQSAGAAAEQRMA